MVENILPKATYSALKGDPRAQLVDCRTQAEWESIGTPDLSALDKSPALIEWQDSNGTPNPDFIAEVAARFAPDTPLYIICRVGVRSLAACEALAAHGFTTLYNVAGGFEGHPDGQGNRRSHDGWQYEELPWKV